MKKSYPQRAGGKPHAEDSCERKLVYVFILDIIVPKMITTNTI